MDLEKVVSRAVVIVPIAHVVACTLFLAGYCIGFGGHIASLFSPSDFFNVTLDHMVLMYTTGLIVPALTVVVRHRAGVSSAVDQLAAETDDAKRAEGWRSLKSMRRVITGLSICIGILAVTYLTLSYRFDTFVQWYLGLSMLTVAVGPLWWAVTSKLKFYGIGVEYAWVTLSFAIGVLGLGMDNGELDRRNDYADLRSSRYACDKLVVVAAAGEKFIAAGKNGVRHVINDDCDIQFSFEKAVPIAEKPLGPSVIEWFSNKGATRKNSAVRP